MSWANCGTDSEGRPIGYGFAAVCDEEGCDTEIDRGLAYACGGMHGGGSYMCEWYFCGEHLIRVETPGKRAVGICSSCLSHETVDNDMRIVS